MSTVSTSSTSPGAGCAGCRPSIYVLAALNNPGPGNGRTDTFTNRLVRQSAPSNVIGANGLAVEDHSQGRRGLCAVEDTTGGSALDGDLCTAKNRRHRWTGHPE